MKFHSLEEPGYESGESIISDDQPNLKAKLLLYKPSSNIMVDVTVGEQVTDFFEKSRLQTLADVAISDEYKPSEFTRGRHNLVMYNFEYANELLENGFKNLKRDINKFVSKNIDGIPKAKRKCVNASKAQYNKFQNIIDENPRLVFWRIIGPKPYEEHDYFFKINDPRLPSIVDLTKLQVNREITIDFFKDFNLDIRRTFDYFGKGAKHEFDSIVIRRCLKTCKYMKYGKLVSVSKSETQHLCPLCEVNNSDLLDIFASVFFERSNLNYQRHLKLYHGITEHGVPIEAPKYRIINKRSPQITYVQCPHCCLKVQLNGIPNIERYLSGLEMYNRHVNEFHYDSKERRFLINIDKFTKITGFKIR